MKQHPRLAQLVFAFVLIGGLPAATAYAMPDCSGLPNIDGRDLPTRYAGAVSVLQDNPTGFGDVLPPNEGDSEGSELDRMFATFDNTHLHIGLTGNTPRMDLAGSHNTVVILMDVNGNLTSNILNTVGRGGAGALAGMHQVRLDAGFSPDYAIETWNEDGTQFAVFHDLSAGTSEPEALTTLTEGVDFAVDNSNLVGVNGDASGDPTLTTQLAATAVNGFRYRIALSDLNITPGGNVRIQALIASASGFISNQNLPPLNPTSGGNGGGFGNLGQFNAIENPINYNNYTGAQFATIDLSGGTSTPTGFDGTGIPADFAVPAISIQNNHTQFGDAAPFSPGLSEGSELDHLYATRDSTNLYVGLTGQTPINDGNKNTILLFIETPDSINPSTLLTGSLTGGSGALQAIDGSSMDVDFHPNYCVQFWRENGASKAILKDMLFDTTTTLAFTNSSLAHTIGGNSYFVDLRNGDGVNDIAGDDPVGQEMLATSAVKGLQLSLRLDSLGLNANEPVRMMACIVSGSGFVANQFLPPLRPSTGAQESSSDTFTPGTAIVDDGTTEVSAALVNAGALTRVTDVNLTLSITHPDMSELTIRLRHNGSGRVVTIWDGNQSGADMSTTFDDSAAAILDDWTAPGAGSFKPQENLITFNGVDPNNGNWTLIINDNVANGSVATLNSWTVDLVEDIGGGVGCLGDATTTAFDLNGFMGDQFVDLAGGTSGPPSTFTASNIPTAFGDPSGMTPLALQNNFTCFGDAMETFPTTSPGSELDQMFVTNGNDRLTVALTGNLEDNENAAVLLIDTSSMTGAGTIGGVTAGPGPVNGLNNLTLDAGFTPDYAITVQRVGGNPLDQFAVFITDINGNSQRRVGDAVRGSGSGQLAPPPGGSELDQMFVQNDANNIYVGMTGNLHDNNIIVFIETEDVAAGTTTNVIDADYEGLYGALRAVSGDTLYDDFRPNYAVTLARGAGSNEWFAQLANITPGQQGGTDLTFTNVGGPNTFYATNSNTAGVNGNPGDDQAALAPTAADGIQLVLSRASLGMPSNSSSVRILAGVVSNSGYWANQFLPGLGGGSNNLEFDIDLSATPAAGAVVDYTVSASPTMPSSFNGVGIPVAMGNSPLATQDNHTGFGNTAIQNTNCMQVAFDNSNTLGVTSISAIFADTAESGLEIEIPFADIGLSPLDMGGMAIEVRLLAMVTGNTGYMSNQFLPPLGTGSAANVAFTPKSLASAAYPGEQFLRYTLVTDVANPADINEDGMVDNDDVIDFVNVLLGFLTDEPQVSNCDFNNDGNADGDDAQLFIEALLN